MCKNLSTSLKEQRNIFSYVVFVVHLAVAQSMYNNSGIVTDISHSHRTNDICKHGDKNRSHEKGMALYASKERHVLAVETVDPMVARSYELYAKDIVEH